MIALGGTYRLPSQLASLTSVKTLDGQAFRVYPLYFLIAN
jgi:hypothetical protein